MRILNRSNLNYKLRKIHQSPICFANAPSGFGKTTAIHSYLDKQDITSIWFSMYAQDDETWAWNKIMTILSKQFRDITFPTTVPNSRDSLDAFVDALEPVLEKPLFIILDDVKTDNLPNIMQALVIYSYAAIDLLHFIIITKDTSEDIINYHFSNTILSLNTNDFAFTKEETLYLCNLEDINLPDNELDSLYHYTNGWALALSLSIESYKNHHNLYYQVDLDNLIHRVLFTSLSTEVQVSFSKLSVLKSFSLSFALKICESQATIQKIVQLEKENHFIQIIDYQTYQFIPIFKDFLTKQLLISSIDIDKLSKEIGYCYVKEEQPLEAIELFLNSNDFDSIIDVFTRYFEIGFADIAPKLIINVFRRLPDKYKNTYPYIYLKWIADCITNFPQIDGATLLEDFKSRIDNNLILTNKNQLYGEYYLIHGFLHFNDVIKMIDDFKIAYDYFDGEHSQFAYPFMITSFGSCHMLFLYYNQVGKLKDIVDYIKNNIHYFIEISNGIHSGSANLITAEYLYETGDYEFVYSHASLAYKEAIDKNQISGALCCLFCLGRLALLQGKPREYQKVKNALLEYYKKTNIPILHNQIDCALGYLYILNNEYNSVSVWLKNGSFDDLYMLPEANMTAYIVHGICLVKTRNYSELGNLSNLIKEKNKTFNFILADIFSLLFEVISHYGNKDFQTALILLQDVIILCSRDNIISPIIETAFAFDRLFDVYIPSTSFEKKVISLVTSHLENNIKDSQALKKLTPKEVEILKLYAQGKTVKCISALKHISINTVQSHTKSIYKKLNISSKSEATVYYNEHFK